MLSRVLEEILPIATFLRRHRAQMAAAAGDDPAIAKDYEAFDVDELQELLKDDQARAAALDEKSFKLSLSLTVALTVLGTLSPLLLDRIASRGLLVACSVLMALSVFNALAGGYVALGAMVALPSYGRGPRMPSKKTSGARWRELASSLARSELVGITRQQRNAACYQHLRNALFCLTLALLAYVCGLPFAATTLKPPTAATATTPVPAAPDASVGIGRFDPIASTPALAQVATWLDGDMFAAGRWDGTISVFRRPRAGEEGPVIVAAMASPSGRGVEMLARLDDETLASSDGRGRLAIWRHTNGGPFRLLGEAAYDPAFGPAESATLLRVGDVDLFATGHEDGHVLVWRWTGADLLLSSVFDVRSRGTPSNPWGLRNVRGLQVWRGSTLVSGSEDGDLVGLAMPDGREVFRMRFNATAQRGINSVSIRGDDLLVANCAVGTADRNAWLFNLSSGRPVLVDSKNLVLDTRRAQAFDFDAILVPGSSGGTDFLAATEEGVLWQGRIDHGRLMIDGTSKVSLEGAAAIAASPDGAFVIAVASSIRLYKPE